MSSPLRLMLFLTMMTVLVARSDFQFPYFSTTTKGITLMSDAFLGPDFVGLSKPPVSSASPTGISGGAMTYQYPFSMFDNGTNQLCSFSSHFVFSITKSKSSKGLIFSNLTHGGEGLTFFLTPYPLSFELQSHYGLPATFIAVLFVTTPPLEGEDRSVRLSINDSRSYLQSVKINYEYLDLLSGTRMFAWVEYDSTLKSFLLFLSNTEEMPPLPLLNVSIDIGDFVRGKMLTAGFSGSSLGQQEFYQLYYWNFFTQSVKGNDKHSISKANVFEILAICVSVVVVLLILCLMYRKIIRNRHMRPHNAAV